MVDLPLNGPGCRSRLRQLRISENMVDWSEEDAGTPKRLAMCNVPDEFVADLGHVCVRLLDADRKRVPVTAYSWQHF
jgi:hypothetical protein